jgi:hypothetical protein
MSKYILCCSQICSPVPSLAVTLMAELSTAIYCASHCRYQSLYVFIVMEELLDFPIIKNATRFTYALINGLFKLLSV